MKQLMAIATLNLTSLVTASAAAAPTSTGWPLWEAFAARFVDAQGRVVDWDAAGKTTSEAQAYALFFALVAKDRARFERILTWTEQKLAGGDLGNRLPAWEWGRSPDGTWKVLDDNSASDADLWLAYTLLYASAMWDERRYASLGMALALQIQMEEAAVLPGFGAVVLPGSTGFRPRRGLFQLNASYVPLQLLLGLEAMIGNRFWSQMAARVPRLIGASAPRGFALDWIAFQAGRGFSLKPLPREQPLASYDAIRVYLWAGMLHPGTPNRRAILRSLTGMRDYLRKNTIPPAAVTEAGVVLNPDGPVGFSGAVIPFLAALKETEALQAQRKRLESEFDAATGLYGRRPRYYDQCLVMFSQGWTENRFGFGPGGSLILNWRQL